jgi:hypothetical protein
LFHFDVAFNCGELVEIELIHFTPAQNIKTNEKIKKYKIDEQSLNNCDADSNEYVEIELLVLPLHLLIACDHDASVPVPDPLAIPLTRVNAWFGVGVSL